MRALRDSFERTTGGLSPVFWVLWWGTLVNRLASFVGIFLGLYLSRERGFDPVRAGAVVTLFGLGGFLAAPLGGVLTDRAGRRATMLSGLVLGAVSVIAIAFTRRPALLVVEAFVCGGVGQLYFPSSGAVIADVVPPADRPRAYGLVYWAMNLGLALGFLIASAVATRSLVALFLADAATTLVCAGLIAWKVPETRPAAAVHDPVFVGLAEVVLDGPYVTFLGLHLVALVIFTQFQLALPLDMAAHGVGPSGFSWMMFYNCLGVVLLQPWLAPALRRFDGARLLAVSALLFAIGYGLNAVSASLPMYLLGASFWTVGEVVGFPVASAVVADLAPAAKRGRYQGAFSMVWGLAMTLSPFVGGFVLAHAGGRALWLGCLAVGAAIAVGHLAAGGARQRRIAALSAVDPDAPAA